MAAGRGQPAGSRRRSTANAWSRGFCRPRASPRPAADPALSAALVEPLSSAETSLLAALAPLAAQFAARRQAFPQRLSSGALLEGCRGRRWRSCRPSAFADDDAQGGDARAPRQRIGRTRRRRRSAGLAEAVKAARAANNGPISIEDARAAAEIARRYALPL